MDFRILLFKSHFLTLKTINFTKDFTHFQLVGSLHGYIPLWSPLFDIGLFFLVKLSFWVTWSTTPKSPPFEPWEGPSRTFDFPFLISSEPLFAHRMILFGEMEAPLPNKHIPQPITLILPLCFRIFYDMSWLPSGISVSYQSLNTLWPWTLPLLACLGSCNVFFNFVNF